VHLVTPTLDSRSRDWRSRSTSRTLCLSNPPSTPFGGLPHAGGSSWGSGKPVGAWTGTVYSSKEREAGVAFASGGLRCVWGTHPSSRRHVLNLLMLLYIEARGILDSRPGRERRPIMSQVFPAGDSQMRQHAIHRIVRSKTACTASPHPFPTDLPILCCCVYYQVATAEAGLLRREGKSLRYGGFLHSRLPDLTLTLTARTWAVAKGAFSP
jgi:hypothetical protein